jgi:molecular chaperone DnaK
MAADNKLLGQFDLVGIPPAPRGVPQIEVTFDIDANGIVSVTAKDKATSKEQQIRIQASGGLSDADIQRMVKEAEANSADDKRRRETVDARNQADTLVHTTEKMLKDLGDKVSAEDKTAIEKATADLKAVMESGDATTIRNKVDELTQVSMKLGEQLYKTQQDPSQAQSGASASPGEPGVVDAEFSEVKDDKKNGTG